MADKRTLTKRNGQIKLMKTMLEKGQEIVDNEELSRNPVKELSALVKQPLAAYKDCRLHLGTISKPSNCLRIASEINS